MQSWSLHSLFVLVSLLWFLISRMLNIMLRRTGKRIAITPLRFELLVLLWLMASTHDLTESTCFHLNNRCNEVSQPLGLLQLDNLLHLRLQSSIKLADQIRLINPFNLSYQLFKCLDILPHGSSLFNAQSLLRDSSSIDSAKRSSILCLKPALK